MADAKLAVVLLTKEALASEFVLGTEFAALGHHQGDKELADAKKAIIGAQSFRRRTWSE